MSKKLVNILRVLSLALFLILTTSQAQAAAAVTINNFSLSPAIVPVNTGSTHFKMTSGISIDLNEFNKACGGTEDSFDWYVYEGTNKKANGEQKFGRTSPSISVGLDENITVDTSVGANLSGDVKYRLRVYCHGGLTSFSLLASSGEFTVTFGSSSDKTHACVTADNKYSCSIANLSNCSDVPVPCVDVKQCVEIGKNLCGKDAGSGGKKYDCNSNNQCVENSSGTYTTSNCDSKCSGGSGDGTTTNFEFKNPIEATSFIELLDVIATWLFNISIPVMVAMIVYAGIMFLISRGDTAKVGQAKKILLYAVVGFTIILIGKGFITLIESILNLGKST